MKILISGFEPYGEMSVNPTQTLVEEAKEFDLDGIEVHTVLLLVNYDECVERLVEEIDRVSPDVVVSCGLYPGRTAITPERIGVNAKDTMAEDPLADKRGRRPVDEPIDPEGPDAIFSMLPYGRSSKIWGPQRSPPSCPTPPGPTSATTRCTASWITLRGTTCPPLRGSCTSRSAPRWLWRIPPSRVCRWR